MSERVWRELERRGPAAEQQLRTAAQDAVLRLALGLFVFDPRAGLTDDQRQRILARLHDTALRGTPFTEEEKARLKGPLLAYIKEYRGRVYAIVEQQFRTGEDHAQSHA